MGAPRQGWASAAGLLTLPPRVPVRAEDLAARMAVAELLARYGMAHDEVDETAMADLFGTDAIVDVSIAGPVFERHAGRVAIVSNFIRVAATQTDQRRHAITNVEVVPVGEHAQFRAYGLVSAADARGLRLAVSCAYSGEAGRDADGLWRFARLWIGMDIYTGASPDRT